MFCYILAQDMLSGKIVCKLNRMMLPYLNFFFFFWLDIIMKVFGILIYIIK